MSLIDPLTFLLPLLSGMSGMLSELVFDALWSRWRVYIWAILSLSALAVVYFASQFLLRFLLWWFLTLLWPMLIAICMLLWFRGKRLDREARNPLRGILPQPFDRTKSP